MPELRLTVVGPGPAYTRRRGRTSSCYVVEGDGTRIVLDIGHGSFASLGARIDPRTIDGIFVSHLHPDHHIDLVPMRHYLKYGAAAEGSVPLTAPAGIRERYDVLNGVEGFLDELPGPTLSVGVYRVGALTIEARRVTHTDDSYGFRVSMGENDPGIVYSGDCGRPEDLLALVRPGDTLLSEAAWGASAPVEAAWHLTAEQAASVAHDGRARRLILTHVLDEGRPTASLRIARRAFDGPTDLAAPGMEVIIDT
jgi:ribonuclease BN (tRNA processing enzyme)